MASELITSPDSAPPSPPSSALVDLRHAAMSIPKETLLAGLNEYGEKRDILRRWLLSKMVQGLHYGVPPGIRQPNVDPSQWRHKPSLYKAGAELVVDLMDVRDVYESDEAAWRMLGSDNGTVVIRCRLLSRHDGSEVGQGLGAGKLGAKSADANKAMKDAQKRAKVAAVLNCYGLSDLFTQDIEDGGPPAHENPDSDPSAPVERPRGQRQSVPSVTKDDLAEIAAAWKAQALDYDEYEKPREVYMHWLKKTVGREFDVSTVAEWTLADVAKCRAALGLTEGGA